MAKIIQQRMMAEIEGDFVVFLIGARINRPWKVHKWLPVARAMMRMIKELENDPSSGFLGVVNSGKVMVQYWRSFEHLERYARAQDREHWPAWVDFNRRVRASSGDVGIWHETYKVEAGAYESIYASMPPFGLGKASALIPVVAHRDAARARMSAASESVEA